MLSSGECATRADLARNLGISCARATRVLVLLDLVPDILDAIVALGDPLPRPIISERMPRPLLKLPAEEQLEALRNLAVLPARPYVLQQENCVKKPTPK